MASIKSIYNGDFEVEAVKLIVLLISLDSLLHKAGTMKDKAFWPIQVLRNGCLSLSCSCFLLINQIPVLSQKSHSNNRALLIKVFKHNGIYRLIKT